ncbi:MAG TPA: hypothetical protein PK402_11485, partial [Tepidisphaeraceae bacterium]|nr:hypothetical protein [Tepidisphaeraceae bacterium]
MTSHISNRSPSEIPDGVIAFRRAVEAGKIDEVSRLLRDDPKVREAINQPLFSFGGRAIMQAKANLDLVDLLLQHGADINLRSDWWAGSWGILDQTNNEQADALIARGAKLDVHSAIHLNRLDVARALLDSNPTLAHARGGDGCLPLHFARSVEAIDLLQRFDIDLDVIDIDHRSTA